MSGDHVPEERPAGGTDSEPGEPIEPSPPLAVPDSAATPGMPCSTPSVSAIPDHQSIATSTPDFDTPRIDALFAAIHRLEATVSGELRGLRASIDRELRAEATREKVVDRLHAELQEYKQDLVLRMLRPVLLDLIQLHDDMDKILDLHADQSVRAADDQASVSQREADLAPEAERLLHFIRGFQQGIDDLLIRQGVESFTRDDDVFDPRTQRAIATIPAVSATQVKTVATRLRKGFRAGDRLIRPELVAVYGPGPEPHP